MLTIVYFIIIILVVISLFIFGKKIPFLSSKITLLVLLVFLIITGFLFFKVVQKINHTTRISKTQNITNFVEGSSTDTENYMSKTVIYVGTTAKISPWSYHSKNHISGFNIDLAKETIKLMAKKISIKTYLSAKEMYEALNNHEIDIIVDLETIDNTTLDKYAYAIGIVDFPLVFIANKKDFDKSLNPKELILSQVLKNKTIAVTDILTLTKSLDNYAINTQYINILPNNDEVLSSVNKGKYNIGFTEYYSFLHYKKNNPKSNLIIIGPLLRNKHNKAQTFVVKNTDIELRKQLNVALNVLKRRGDISNLSIKYFNEDVTL